MANRERSRAQVLASRSDSRQTVKPSNRQTFHPHMLPLTPALLIATANAFTGFGEDEFQRGGMLWRFLKEVNQPHDAPWSAAFVHHAGYWSHHDPRGGRSSWPLPATGDCNEL